MFDFCNEASQCTEYIEAPPLFSLYRLGKNQIFSSLKGYNKLNFLDPFLYYVWNSK